MLHSTALSPGTPLNVNKVVSGRGAYGRGSLQPSAKIKSLASSAIRQYIEKGTSKTAQRIRAAVRHVQSLGGGTIHLQTKGENIRQMKVVPKTGAVSTPLSLPSRPVPMPRKRPVSIPPTTPLPKPRRRLTGSKAGISNEKPAPERRFQSRRQTHRGAGDVASDMVKEVVKHHAGKALKKMKERVTRKYPLLRKLPFFSSKRTGGRRMAIKGGGGRRLAHSLQGL